MLSRAHKGKWKHSIVATVDAKQQGLEDLWAAVLAHRQHLESSGRARELAERRLKDGAGEGAAELAPNRGRDAVNGDPKPSRRLPGGGAAYQTAEEAPGPRPEAIP